MINPSNDSIKSNKGLKKNLYITTHKFTFFSGNGYFLNIFFKTEIDSQFLRIHNLLTSRILSISVFFDSLSVHCRWGVIFR